MAVCAFAFSLCQHCIIYDLSLSLVWSLRIPWFLFLSEARVGWLGNAGRQGMLVGLAHSRCDGAFYAPLLLALYARSISRAHQLRKEQASQQSKSCRCRDWPISFQLPSARLDLVAIDKKRRTQQNKNNGMRIQVAIDDRCSSAGVIIQHDAYQMSTRQPRRRSPLRQTHVAPSCRCPRYWVGC